MFYIGFSCILNLIFEINLDLNYKTVIVVFLYPIIFLISSHLMINIILLKKPKKIENRLKFNLSNNKVFYFSILFYFFGIMLFFVTYTKIGYIPALMDNVDGGRVDAKAGLGSFILLGTAFLYTSAIFGFAYFDKLTIIKKFFLVIILISSCIVIGGLGFRGPVAYLVLYILLVKFFLSKEYINLNKIPYRFFIYGFLFIILLSIIDFVRHGNEFSLNSLSQIYWTMTVNLYNLNNIVIFFENNDFFYGKSFIDDMLVAFPGSDTKFFGVVLKDLLDLDFAGEGMTVTAPGEGYANGGFIGVFFHAIFFGILYGLIYEYLSRKETISSRILMIIIVISFSKVVASGFMPSLIFTIAPTLLISIMFIYLTRMKNENTILRKA